MTRGVESKGSALAPHRVPCNAPRVPRPGSRLPSTDSGAGSGRKPFRFGSDTDFVSLIQPSCLSRRLCDPNPGGEATMQAQPWGHWGKGSILPGLSCRSVGQEKAVFGVLTNHYGILQTIRRLDTLEQEKTGMTRASVLVPSRVKVLVPLLKNVRPNPCSVQCLQGDGKKWSG